MFSLIQSSHDLSEAMSYNPLVREQRVNFYIYHMRQGWPHGIRKKNSQPVIEKEADCDFSNAVVSNDQYSF